MKKSLWEDAIKLPILDLRRLARTLEIILRMPLIRLIGLKSPIHLAPAILGTKAMHALLNRERLRVPS